MSEKFLVPNICHIEIMLYIKNFIVANILGHIPY